MSHFKNKMFIVSKVTIPNNDCASRMESFGTIIVSKICAFSFFNDYGVCMGDSGGPLILNDVHNTIVGALSWSVLGAQGVS